MQNLRSVKCRNLFDLGILFRFGGGLEMHFLVTGRKKTPLHHFRCKSCMGEFLLKEKMAL